MTEPHLAAQPKANPEVRNMPHTPTSAILSRLSGVRRRRVSDRRLVSVDLRGHDALCAAPLLAQAAASTTNGVARRALQESYLRLACADPDAPLALTLSVADARIAGQTLLDSARPPLDHALCAALARVAMALTSASHSHAA